MVTYDNLVELENRINAYFDYCDEVGKPYTKTGFARYLGIGRHNIGYYLEHSDKTLADAMNNGLERVIESVEERTLEGKTSPAFGSFWLTNVDRTYWKNRQEIEQKTVNITSILDMIDGESTVSPPIDTLSS